MLNVYVLSPDCSVCGDEPRSQHYGKTGMCYHVYEELKTWDAAAMDCVERGGKLAMPKDATINFILTEMIEEYTGTDFWIGLSSDDSKTDQAKHLNEIVLIIDACILHSSCPSS